MRCLALVYGACIATCLLILVLRAQAVDAPDVEWHKHVDVHWEGSHLVRHNRQMRQRFNYVYNLVMQHNREYALGRSSYYLTYNVRFASSTYGLKPSSLTPAQFKNIRNIRTQYASFAANLAPSIDWSASGKLQAVQDQGPCSACWAFAATAAVEAATAIATGAYGNAVPKLSEQQLIDCEQPDNVSMGSCQGGDPFNALQYVINNGLASQADYPYVGQQSATCRTAAAARKAATVWRVEMVPPQDDVAFMAALNGQPVVVFLQADVDSFRFYGGGVYNDPTCNGSNIVHSMVVVGYDNATDATGRTVPVYKLRNSWGSSWGEGGYMRMQRIGGTGVCGITYAPPLYPVVPTPSGNPCANSPCGADMCQPTGPISYNCSWCPPGFAATRDTAPTCAIQDYCGSQLDNPCGGGNCTNDGYGGYLCSCDPSQGFLIGSNTNGLPTCVTGNEGGGWRTYTVQPGDLCFNILKNYGLNFQGLQNLNPGLDCTNLIPGTTLVVAPSYSPNTGAPTKYVVQKGDICFSILKLFGINITTFQKLNPNINCFSQLKAGTVVTVAPPFGPAYCTAWYTANNGDQCVNVARAYGETLADILSLNQGLTYSDCSNLPAGRMICARGNQLGVLKNQVCGKLYTVPSSPKVFCPILLKTFGLQPAQLDALNTRPPLHCNAPLRPGSKICVAPYNLKCSRWYKANAGDTCASIPRKFNIRQTLIFRNLNPAACSPGLLVGDPLCVAA